MKKFVALAMMFVVNFLHASSSKTVLTIDVNTGITPFIAEYIEDALKEASDNHLGLLITLDTPGGLLDSTRKIVTAILSSKKPVVVYVSPKGARAGSAGAFISLAAHITAMAPSTNIGAAHPVGVSGEDIEGDMKEKITNDTKAWIRGIAQERGRNVHEAEKFVFKSTSLTASEALKANVIDFIANNEQELLVKVSKKYPEFNGAILKKFPKSLAQEIMSFFADPNLLYILLLVGALGIFIEFNAPGLILPGVIGVICLATVLGVRILPINWFGAILFLAALALFIAELYFVSFGALSLAGIVFFILGSFLLFDVPGSSFLVSPTIIWITAGCFLLVIFIFGVLIIKSKIAGKKSNVDALIGKVVKVKENISPNVPGKIFLNGSYWNAYADEEILKNQEVIVKSIQSTKVFVSKKED